MVCWDRCDNVVIGIITPRQVRWLRTHLSDYRNRVTRAIEDGVDDSVVSAVLGARRSRDRCAARACLTDMHKAITASLESLPDRGGVIKLRDDEARWHWVWTLHELCIAVEVRLGRKFPSAAATELIVWLRQVIDEVAVLGELPLGLGSVTAHLA